MPHNGFKKNRSHFDLMQPLRQTMKQEQLGPTKRLVLIGLYFCMDSDGQCYPSYEGIAAETGLSVRAIKDNIKKLVQEGWISYEQGHYGRSNQYSLNLVKLGIVEPPKPKLANKPKKEAEPLFEYEGRYYTNDELKAKLDKLTAA